MTKRKFCVLLSRLFYGILTTIIFTGCVGSKKESASDETFSITNSQNEKNDIQKTNELITPVDNKESFVSLEIVNVSSEKIILKLSNKTKENVYLFYDLSATANANVFYYWFRCKEAGGKEINYNQYTSHIIPGLEPLSENKSFLFEVSPLPKIKADCKISLLYYDDEKVVNLVNNPLDINTQESDFIEKSKRSALVQFQLNNE